MHKQTPIRQLVKKERRRINITEVPIYCISDLIMCCQGEYNSICKFSELRNPKQTCMFSSLLKVTNDMLTKPVQIIIGLDVQLTLFCGCVTYPYGCFEFYTFYTYCVLLLSITNMAYHGGQPNHLGFTTTIY